MKVLKQSKCCISRKSHTLPFTTACSSTRQPSSHRAHPSNHDRRMALGILSTLPAMLASASHAADEMGGVTFLFSDDQVENFSKYQRQLVEYNKRIQTQNKAPDQFPAFVRDKFDIGILAPGYSTTPEGLVYKDFKVGSGEYPVDSQQVTFAYTAYNESGALVDSSYRQGDFAKAQLGIKGLIPGFELGLKGMKPGGQRRIVVPPELGPPVGPATFFSAKQCEVFDVELFDVKSCRREGAFMFSKVVCE